MDFFNTEKFFAAFNLLKLFSPVCSLSANKSAMAIILVLVFCDMELITAVPLLPQPITPTLIAELLADPKTIEGFKIVNAEMAAVDVRNVLRFMMCCFNDDLKWCKALAHPNYLKANTYTKKHVEIFMSVYSAFIHTASFLSL